MTSRLQTRLSELEFSELLPLFEAQGIDDSVLGDLTDTDLKEIGIEKLGDRKKLLKAFGEGSTSPEREKPVEIAVTEAHRSTPQDQFTYDARNGEIIITGFTGKGDVVVPDKFDDLDLPVRVIGAKAFKDNGMLTSIILSNGITTIDGGLDYLADGAYNQVGAFWGCSSLTKITLPERLATIESFAFQRCSSLTSITLPESLKYIGRSAFDGCSSLTSITIPEGVTHIGDHVFSSCRSLTSVTIPESVTDIGDRAFQHCSSLTSITIPEGVTSIGDGAFYRCTGLTSITIPESVTHIGDRAFQSCSSLTSITIPESVTHIGEFAFEDCSSLTSITIPESVTHIGDWAFAECPNLTIHRPTKKQNIVAEEPTKENHPVLQRSTEPELPDTGPAEKPASLAFYVCMIIIAILILLFIVTMIDSHNHPTP
jgi:hypothetical protein